MNKAVNLIQQYIAGGQLEKALVECKALVHQTPTDVYLKKYLSHIYYLKEDHINAIKESLEILEKLPNDFDCINNIGNYYFKLEEYDRALTYIHKANTIKPNHPAPYQNKCEILMKLRNFEEASKELDICISLHEQFSNDYFKYKSTLILRIEIYIALKQQVEAVEFIKKYLNNKFDGELFLHLVHIDKKNIDTNMLNKCIVETNIKVYSSKLAKYQNLVPLFFALANYYEKENPKLSEDYYIKANKEVLEIQRLTMLNFQKRLLKIIDNFEILKSKPQSDPLKGKNHIFILGMPRSGTTLTESLVTANQDTFGAGELFSFYDLSYKFIIDGEFDQKKIDSVGDEYISRTNFFLSKGETIVDKLPDNYNFIGYIRKFLPSAKIILILRDPWDLAISLFKQRYVTNVYYSSSMFNIGIQIANFEASIRYWHNNNVLDTNVMIIKYEELVSNFDLYQKKIYHFCEINSAYEPEKREKFFAKTASINQVQNKVHDSSVLKKDFINLKNEFLEAFQSQREFWHLKLKFDHSDNYFGYKI